MTSSAIVPATHVQVPATLAEVADWASGLSRLLTATQWERAAIVYAWTEPAERGGIQTNGDNPPLPIARFVGLGISGLRDRSQVRMYRKAWESAAAEIGSEEMLDIHPGDMVELPDLTWKDHFGEPSGEVQERVARSVLEDPDKRRAFMEDERNVAAVEEAAAETPTIARRVEARLAEKRRADPVPERAPQSPNRTVDEVVTGLRRVFDQTTSTGVTFRDVIRTVQENPNAVELRDPTAPTARQSRVLGDTLQSLGDEAHRLADPLLLTEGSDEA